MTTRTLHFGPTNGSLLVKTLKEGLLSRMGHDLVIEVRDWSGRAELGDGAPTTASLDVVVRAGSLEVVGPPELSESDRRGIHGDMRAKVLHTDRFPEVRFRAERVPVPADPLGRGTFAVAGELELAGCIRRVELAVAYEPRDGRIRLHGRHALRQTDYWIQPFKAPLGVLKVQDVVQVEWDLLVAPA